MNEIVNKYNKLKAEYEYIHAIEGTPHSKKHDLLEYYVALMKQTIEEFEDILEEVEEVLEIDDEDEIEEYYIEIEQKLKTDTDFMRIFGPQMALFSVVSGELNEIDDDSVDDDSVDDDIIENIDVSN